MVEKILMLCVNGRAKALLDQFEKEQGDPQNYIELKKQLNAVFDSDSRADSDCEVHMIAFERCVQRIGESEEDFMTHLLQLYKAADPQAKTNVINHAIKCKFLQGISDTLRRNIFIFCSNPYDEKFLMKVRSKLAGMLQFIFSCYPLLKLRLLTLFPLLQIHQIQLLKQFSLYPESLRNKISLQCGSSTNNKSRLMPISSNFR